MEFIRRSTPCRCSAEGGDGMLGASPEGVMTDAGITGFGIDGISGSSITSVFRLGIWSGTMREGLLGGAMEVGGGIKSFAFSSFKTGPEGHIIEE